MASNKRGYNFTREEAQSQRGHELWRGPARRFGLLHPLFEPMVDRLYEGEEFEDPFTTAFESPYDELTREEIQRVKDIHNGTL